MQNEILKQFEMQFVKDKDTEQESLFSYSCGIDPINETDISKSGIVLRNSEGTIKDVFTIGKVTPPKATKKGKQKVARTHDFGSKTKAEFFGQFRSAIRKLWMFSQIRREALRQAKKAPNRYLCANCKDLFKSNEVDVNHIVECGALKEFTDFNGFIERMFQEDLTKLEVLCKDCHKNSHKEETTKL